MDPLFQQTEQLYEKSLNPFWIAEVVDYDFIIIIANPAAQRVEPRQVAGASIRQLAESIGNADELLAGYYQAVKTGESLQFEQRPWVNGKEYLFRTLIVPIKNAAGEITHIWGSAHNLTDFLDPQKELLAMNKLLDEKVKERTQQLNAAVEKLERLSITDDLTELANRRHFDQQFNQAVAQAKATQSLLSLVYLDIDHFKQFNDQFGHSVGDHCLQLVAAELAQFFDDKSALVARYGGEEFVILLPQTDGSAAEQQIKRLLNKVAAKRFHTKNNEHRITISALVGGKSATSALRKTQ
jgi:diguanylate cyclase (GGDEF)-like protein